MVNIYDNGEVSAQSVPSCWNWVKASDILMCLEIKEDLED